MPVFTTFRDEADTVFQEAKDRPEIWKEVFKDRALIGEVFVDTLLASPDPAGGGRPAGETVPDRVLADWAAGDGAILMEAWTAIRSALDAAVKGKAGADVTSGADATTIPPPETLMRNRDVARQIQCLEASLEKGIRDGVRAGFDEPLAQITVWETIRRYVENVLAAGPKRSPEVVLKNLFKEYAAAAKHFARRRERARDVTKPRRKVFAVGVADDAEQCFRDLGIRKTGFLAELLTESFGADLTFIEPTQELRQEFVFFSFLTGEVPSFTTNGLEQVAELLRSCKDAPVPSPLDWNWSDVRFPQWVSQWLPEQYLKG
jgi:hypothetical protein